MDRVNEQVNNLLTILSSDPGFRNYGFSVVQFRRDSKGNLAFRVRECGHCTATVSNLKSGKVLVAQLDAYKQFLSGKIDKYGVQAFSAERFMTRGVNGPSIEMVNFMLGVMVSSFNKPVKLWPAVTWKNAVRRKGVDLSYWYKWCKTSPHQLDATLIGLYTGYRAYGYTDFGDLDLEDVMPSIVDQMESVSLEPLTNRVARR